MKNTSSHAHAWLMQLSQTDYDCTSWWNMHSSMCVDMFAREKGVHSQCSTEILKIKARFCKLSHTHGCHCLKFCKENSCLIWLRCADRKFNFTRTIGEERNPNILSPLIFCKGSTGGSPLSPMLFSRVISSFSRCSTISQHFSAETLANASLGHSSKDTWNLGKSFEG